MNKNTVNDTLTVNVEEGKDGMVYLNGRALKPDIIMVREGLFHVIHDGKSTMAEVTGISREEKTVTVRIRGTEYSVKVENKFDLLLKEMGIDFSHNKKISDLRAPMPGLVSDVAVMEGQSLQKGDKIVVLEAMKMENILKAPETVIVKKVHILKGQTVEKNEVLVTFE